jgi:AcrR family transcriptional regulator
MAPADMCSSASTLAGHRSGRVLPEHRSNYVADLFLTTKMASKSARVTSIETPRAGRPRNPETERDIIKAAASILIEQGFGGLTMERVAAQAGVGKMTLYRRWKSRSDLVAAVLDDANDAWPMPKPQSDSLAEDLRTLYRNWVAGMSGAGKVIPVLIAEAIQNPELAQLLHNRFILPRRSMAIAIIDRAVERGELSPDADSQTAIDMFMGRMWYRQLVTGEKVRVADENKVISLLLHGLQVP